MRVMQSQASQSEEGLCPNATFKGTHQDLEDQCIESREEKDQKICDMLVPVVQNGVIYCSENSAAGSDVALKLHFRMFVVPTFLNMPTILSYN